MKLIRVAFAHRHHGAHASAPERRPAQPTGEALEPPRGAARPSEFFAPLPLAALALVVVNDVWLKPAFHSALTGKLSDIAICFLMPLFFSEVLGLLLRIAPAKRLLIAGVVAASLFAGLEVVPPCTALALRALAVVGPWVGIHRPFRMTSDWTDLFCTIMIVPALAYGRRRLELAKAPEPEPIRGRYTMERDPILE